MRLARPPRRAPGPRPRARGSYARRWLATGVLALAALTGVAAPASAHDALLSTDPPDGATVALAPDAVGLTFSEPVVELGTAVLVLGPDGQPISAGSAVVSGAVVSQPLAPERPAGAYVVEWRVTSADGHPISGRFTFTATSAVAPPAAETPAAAAPAVETPAAQPPAPSAARTPAAEKSPAPSAGRRVPWMIAAGAAVLLAAGATWWVRRARR